MELKLSCLLSTFGLPPIVKRSTDIRNKRERPPICCICQFNNFREIASLAWFVKMNLIRASRRTRLYVYMFYKI